MYQPSNQATVRVLPWEKQLCNHLDVSAVAFDNNQTLVQFSLALTDSAVLADVFSLLADKAVDIDLLIKRVSVSDQQMYVDFSIHQEETKYVKELLSTYQTLQSLVFNTDVAKLTLVGVGMRNHTGIMPALFQYCKDQQLMLDLLTVSECKIAILIPEHTIEKAAKDLHAIFCETAEQGVSIAKDAAKSKNSI